MQKLKKIIKNIAYWIFIGALAMVGMRAVEWTIAKPPVMLVVCIEKNGKFDKCIKTKNFINYKRKFFK